MAVVGFDNCLMGTQDVMPLSCRERSETQVIFFKLQFRAKK